MQIQVTVVEFIVIIFHWFLLYLSALLYALPFLFTCYLWWLIFFFPIPLLYLVRTINLSFVHGYIWGVVVFALHLSGGICVIADMAGTSWPVGLLLGIIMVLYQALSIALLFWCAAKIAQYFAIRSLISRLFLWAAALGLFIMWTDWYCLWIFGIKEGHPLMHPLIPLAQQPCLLLLLPIIGKPLLTVLFLLFSVSSVALMWLRTYKAFLMWVIVCMPWIWCWCSGSLPVSRQQWLVQIKSIPFMAHSTSDNPIAMMKNAGDQLKKVIANYPQANIIVMPESAFNCTVLQNRPELLDMWSEQNIGKAVHVIFGSFRWDTHGNYYNTAYWAYNGQLQQCFDKRHAVLISERLAWLVACPLLKDIYCSSVHSTTISVHDRLPFIIAESMAYIPYICSELFFNEYPDDIYINIAVIALVNDTAFLRRYASYISDLLFLVARMKAIAWQRDIVYVSYSRSFFIDKSGMIAKINE